MRLVVLTPGLSLGAIIMACRAEAALLFCLNDNTAILALIRRCAQKDSHTLSLEGEILDGEHAGREFSGTINTVGAGLFDLVGVCAAAS